MSRTTPLEVRVEWAGSALRLRGQADLLEQVRTRLPDFYSWTPTTSIQSGAGPGRVPTARIELGAAGLFDLQLPGGLRVVGAPDEDILRAAASRIELVIVSRLPDHAVVHAAAVAVDGRAIVLPGASRAGKSTLAHALVGAGATYLSDEFAVIDDEGRVHAYPRPIALRTGAGERRRLVPVGSDASVPPRPVALVASLHHDARGWSTRTVTPASAVMTLLAHCVTARHDPRGALQRLGAAMAGAPAIAGTRGEAEQAAGLLLALAEEMAPD